MAPVVRRDATAPDLEHLIGGHGAFRPARDLDDPAGEEEEAVSVLPAALLPEDVHALSGGKARQLGRTGEQAVQLLAGHAIVAVTLRCALRGHGRPADDGTLLTSLLLLLADAELVEEPVRRRKDGKVVDPTILASRASVAGVGRRPLGDDIPAAATNVHALTDREPLIVLHEELPVPLEVEVDPAARRLDHHGLRNAVFGHERAPLGARLARLLVNVYIDDEREAQGSGANAKVVAVGDPLIDISNGRPTGPLPAVDGALAAALQTDVGELGDDIHRAPRETTTCPMLDRSGSVMSVT